nr:DUF167 domain-containing protein [Stakelama flava]
MSVRANPKASKEAILPGEGYLAVRLTAPPVDGAANKALVKLIAKAFSVAKRDVTIESGEAARMKRIFVAGDPQALAARAVSLYEPQA